MSTEHWQITKSTARSPRGVVVSQHYLAAEAGAQVLRDGGNAFDAAIAASFAVGVVEPWMSGIGGGGVMVATTPGEPRARSIYFGMRASARLDPADYPLSGGTGGDLFAWPAVEADRNVHGPYSVAIPGQVAGMALAHRRFGSVPWKELLQPAISLAREGVEADWIATVRIAAAAPVLSLFAPSATWFLPGGFVPAGQWGGPPPRLVNSTLADTLECLAHAGADDFYRGDIAARLVADARDLGIALDADDLADYAALERDALAIDYRDARVHADPGLTGGPSLAGVLGELGRSPRWPSPGADYFVALARALRGAFDERFDAMGHDALDPACTTHVSVVDTEGRAVSLTQTLLSVFGSKVTLPDTGILMNNGIMWFDPRPGRANSIAPGRWPLANMCPVLVEEGNRLSAIGGSGGRRIIGAVAQVCAHLADFGMDLESALSAPRIDVSGGADVLVDPRLPQTVSKALSSQFNTRLAQSMVYPNLYGCPNGASIEAGTTASGTPFIHSPVSAAVGA